MEKEEVMEYRRGWITAIVEKFLTGYASMILVLFAVVVGVGAILLTPREEEPQIVVPLADVYVYYPGASAQEVEYLVASPLEKLLWQIDGVEYVYSVSKRDMAIVTVRFYVGEDRERSLIKLYNKIYSHIDRTTPGVTQWVIKPVEIDDVPIVNLTLFSRKYDDYALRRIGEEVLNRLESIENLSRTQIVGGLPRQVRIELDSEKLAGSHLTPLEVYQVLQRENISLTAGSFNRDNRSVPVFSGPFLENIDHIRNLVVGSYQGKPVYLNQVAKILDGPAEQTTYTRIAFGPASERYSGYPTSSAVTLALSKKKGTNAVRVAEEILEKMEEIRRKYLPQEVEVVVTRNYGETADEKVNELLSSLLFAILTVVVLLAFTLGWREALIVSAAVPISFALALFVNYLSGYTINRVTLFALILSLGLVVDDPITNVDNIQRHILSGRHRSPILATLFGVAEVIPPVIMSTLAIIVSFLPMFFITGMMGPYMGPMAINVPLTVTFSTVCALTIVPWAAFHLLKRFHRYGDGVGELVSSSEKGARVEESWVMGFYRRLVKPFLDSRRNAYFLLVGMVLLLGLAGFLALSGLVPLKMLPFDNKNEFQIVVDMPEGATLEQTDAVVRAYEEYLRGVAEVRDITSYVGTSSPMDFNGMVRHYYLRRGPNVADLRVNLAHKRYRSQQSHTIVLRLRRDLEAISDRFGAKIKIVEVPPGPPVISTLVAEVTGSPNKSYGELIAAARVVKERMEREDKVVDVDWTVEARYLRLRYRLDKVKAAVHGIGTTQVVRTLRLALSGMSPGTVHLARERNPLQIYVILPRKERSSREKLASLRVKGRLGNLVSLGEIGEFVELESEQPIYHKNLTPIVYIFGEMAGRPPAEAVLSLQSYFSRRPLEEGFSINWAGEGEWRITLRVFRDLGIAFGVALVGIYLLLVLETNSLLMPLIIMLAIPLTAIGIMPGFYLLNLISNRPVGGFEDPVFFTATGMIGMIALGGIVVRNSIVLIEFIQNARGDGVELKEAILQSGGVRFRPIMLTAMTTGLGAWPITLDPIFSGLAWSLIFGLVASTLFTLLVVPVVFWLVYGPKGGG
ncbi:MAG: efflux RND transporter permease subunit, partial [Planctomycetota bacterium]